MYDVIVIGGGAAGFYGAIHLAQTSPNLKVAILERSNKVLSKVKVSGGGRCNVTHAEFNPGELVKNYPRGEKELLGPFHMHGSGDTVAFFENHGISLKTEADGRMFPVTNTSQTIIDFFLSEVERLGVTLLKNCAAVDIEPLKNDIENPESRWKVRSVKKTYLCKSVLLTTGGSPKIWNLLRKLKHTIIDPVPSLFTFNIKDCRIEGIQGVSTSASVRVIPNQPSGWEASSHLRSIKAKNKPLESEGQLMITHWGLSGPAILKLSSWGAIILNSYNYRFRIVINWLPDYHPAGVTSQLKEVKDIEAKKTVFRTRALDIPRRLWTSLVKASGITPDMKWANITKTQMERLINQLTNSEFLVHGKSTFKEEFVTAGGVSLKEINFKTFESKIHPHLYFAGEVIDIDAITGGFNFQNAWTGAYVAATAIANSQ